MQQLVCNVWRFVQIVDLKICAAGLPFLRDFGQDCGDEAEEGRLIRKEGRDACSALDLFG